MSKKNKTLPPVIRANNIQKTFKLPHAKNNSIKGLVVNMFRRDKGFETQTVLQDVAFEVQKNEFFGIVGRNGSGKSTLLKILAGIYAPNGGSVEISGRLVPFIELGVGFNPELSGRENVFLNGALLGFSRAEMSEMYDEIVAFAELERFMDQKLKNYSSGMQVRLAFSIAIRAKGDILVLDEVLAVGDSKFQEKCFDYFDEIKGKRTVLLVSHDMRTVKKYCDRVLVLEKSKVIDIGDPEDVVLRYSTMMANEDLKVLKTTGDGVHVGTGKAKITSVKLYQENKEVRDLFEAKPFTVKVDFTVDSSMEEVGALVSLFDANNAKLFSASTYIDNQKVMIVGDEQSISIQVDNVLAPGSYKINFGIFDKTVQEPHDQFRNALTFKVRGDRKIDAILNIGYSWKIEKK